MNYSSNAQIHKEAISSSNKLQESLLEAVEILHNGFIANEQISKVIECNIIDDSKKAQGIYTVDYMNSKFEVNCYIEETYNVGDIVFVLIPDGDFAKTKMILGSSDGSGQGINWVTQEELNAAVAALQRNFQAGVEAIGAACTRKGSPPASSSLEDTVAAIDAIQTGGNYDTLEVNADGTYIATEDPRGIDAYDVVVVSKDVGQPHTVVFYGPDGNIIKTQANVPYHGYASCTLLDGTIINGQYFKGWNPAPSNVVEDMLCYPEYGDYIITPGQIEDDWETICADNGEHYPLGSYKSLVITQKGGSFTTYDGLTRSAIFSTSFNMVKVAEGEDGSTSTWISTGFVNYNSGNFNRNGYCPSFLADWAYRSQNYGMNPPGPAWRTSDQRAFLNQQLLPNLPSALVETIKNVTKYSRDFVADNVNADINNDMETLDKIWVPSVREFKTVIEAKGYSIPFNYARSGIDYSTVYIPTYTQANNMWTRDLAVPSMGTYYRRDNIALRTKSVAEQEWMPTSYPVFTNGYDAGIVIGFCL